MSTASAADKRRQYQRDYYQRNRDREIARIRAWQEQNPFAMSRGYEYVRHNSKEKRR